MSHALAPGLVGGFIDDRYARGASRSIAASQSSA